MKVYSGQHLLGIVFFSNNIQVFAVRFAKFYSNKSMNKKSLTTNFWRV